MLTFEFYQGIVITHFQYSAIHNHTVIDDTNNVVVTQGYDHTGFLIWSIRTRPHLLTFVVTDEFDLDSPPLIQTSTPLKPESFLFAAVIWLF